MNYQLFRGSDVNEALSAVRASLGPDALIYSTRQVNNGRPGGFGHSWVEIAATPSQSRGPFAHAASVDQSAEDARRVRRVTRKMTNPATPARTPPPNKSPSLLYGLDAEKVEQELRNLRSMLEELESARPPRQRASALLARLGIEGSLAHQLSQGASRAARKGDEALRAFLKERMRSLISVSGELLDRPGPALIACVGPTGVGKTTTLAKLAARARLDHGRTVAVISLDTFRVGAVEQWQRYASLMGITFSAVHDVDEFTRVLENTRAELVLVDTTGRSGTEAGRSLAGDCLAVRSSRQRHVMLVLPAWLRARDAERVARSYQEMHPNGLCLTKLDETLEPGGALHGVLPDNLPFSYLCDGPRVPEDIAVADSDSVVNAIFMDAS